MTLDDVKLLYTKHILDKNDGARFLTARELGVSIRTLRNYIIQMKEAGIYQLSKEEREDKEEELNFLTGYKFPTNKKRLDHLDSH